MKDKLIFVLFSICGMIDLSNSVLWLSLAHSTGLEEPSIIGFMSVLDCSLHNMAHLLVEWLLYLWNQLFLPLNEACASYLYWTYSVPVFTHLTQLHSLNTINSTFHTQWLSTCEFADYKLESDVLQYACRIVTAMCAGSMSKRPWGVEE